MSKLPNDFFSKFGEGQSDKVRQSDGNYLLGLANLIQGNRKDTREHLENAIQLNPSALCVDKDSFEKYSNRWKQ